MGAVRDELLVHVKKCDIEKGEPNCTDSCAISRSVARIIHSSVRNYDIHTAGDGIEIGGKMYVPATQKDSVKLDKFIMNFDDSDRRKYCRPTTIRLKLDV